MDATTLKAINAVKTILNNLETSTFAEEFGSNAVKGLKEYKTDMVIDIVKAMTGLIPDDIKINYILDNKNW